MILPLVFAFLSHVGLSYKAILFVFHIFVLGLFSSLLTVIYSLARYHVPWPIAMILTVFLATIPVVSTQADLTSAEIPATCMSAVCAIHFYRHRFNWSIVSALMAFLFRNSSIITAAVLCMSLILDRMISFESFGPPRKRPTLCQCLCCGCLFIGEALVMVASNVMNERVLVFTVPIWIKVYLLLLCSPDIIFYLILVGIGGIVLIHHIFTRLVRTHELFYTITFNS